MTSICLNVKTLNKNTSNINSLYTEPLIGDLIGDNIYNYDCAAYISCKGIENTECTKFPSDVISYELNLLRIKDIECYTEIPIDTYYLEAFENGIWNLLYTYTSTESYGWIAIVFTISPNNFVGQFRVRWSSGIKEWSQEPSCITPTCNFTMI